MFNNKEIVNFTSNLLNVDLPIYILGHINTDYDSVGSCLTICHILNKLNKQAKVILAEDGKILFDRANINDYKTYIFNEDVNTLNNKEYVCLLMDMNTTARASNFEQVVSGAKYLINIDHHNNNNLPAKFKFVDDKSGANCENVLKIALQAEKQTNIKILDKDFCSFLAMGIITDTCNIEKSSNLKQTLWAVDIIKPYVSDINQIANKVYNQLNKEQQQILEKALPTKKVYNFISCYSVNHDWFCNLNLIHNDYAMALARITDIDSNTVILFEQKMDGYSVWEFRSKDIETYPINQIALNLGGGGHKNASGATILNKTTEQVVNEFLSFFKNKH